MQLYTCFEYRRFIAHNYGDFKCHLAFVICASMPGRILRCFARPASMLKCLESAWDGFGPGLLYALAPRSTATAQTRIAAGGAAVQPCQCRLFALSYVQGRSTMLHSARCTSSRGTPRKHLC